MTTQTSPIQVGTEVIIVKSYGGDKPEVYEVEKVTPSGKQFVANGIRFKVGYSDTVFEQMGDLYERKTAILFTPEKMKELSTRYLNKLQADEEKRVENAKRKQEAELERAKQLAEVQALQPLDAYIVWRQEMPGGVRTYLLNIPVKPEYAQHKAFDLLLVSTRDSEKYDWHTGEKSPCVKAQCSSCRGRSGDHLPSGGSSSEGDFASDDEALWSMISSRYHDSW